MFLGITRFSLFTPAAKGWHLSKSAKDKESINDYKMKLFNPVRLEERINIFFNISLPTLSIMKGDFQYIHVLQISDQLPLYYKNKILDFAVKYPFLKIQEFDVQGNSSESLFDIIKKNIELDTEEKAIGVFNLDDDDLLSIRFFEKSKKYINNHYLNHGISFGYGLTGLIQGKNVLEVKESYLPKINIGLMRIGSISEKGMLLPKNGNHRFSDKYLPIIVDSRDIMYFWGRHFNQDSSDSFNAPQQQLRGILNDLSRFGDIEISQQIMNDFPQLNFNPIGNLKTNLSVNKIIEANEFFPIELSINSSKILLKIEYDILNLEKVLDPSKAGLISFNFNKDVAEIEGLTKSANSEIGFFKYLGAKEAKNINYISLQLPTNISLQSITLRLWKYKGKMSINKITIYNLDNSFN